MNTGGHAHRVGSGLRSVGFRTFSSCPRARHGPGYFVPPELEIWSWRASRPDSMGGPIGAGLPPPPCGRARSGARGGAADPAGRSRLSRPPRAIGGRGGCGRVEACGQGGTVEALASGRRDRGRTGCPWSRPGGGAGRRGAVTRGGQGAPGATWCARGRGRKGAGWALDTWRRNCPTASPPVAGRRARRHRGAGFGRSCRRAGRGRRAAPAS